MEQLPDFARAFEYENAFYLSCDTSRIKKVLAHYELFTMAQDIPGDLIECGVFKGASLARFAMFRQLCGQQATKKIIGFDTFGTFPETRFAADTKKRAQFIAEAGARSISVKQMQKVLRHKQCHHNVELIAGDICRTVPAYVRRHPRLRISLLNLDTDIYEPAVVILEHFWPRIVPGGILILDDYGVFPGETRAVDDYFKSKKSAVKELPFCTTPRYIIKK